MHPGSLRDRWTCSRLSLRTSPRESSRAVTLPVTTIIVSSRFRFPRLSWNRPAGAGKADGLLRPALQRGMSGFGQQIDAALGAVEPAIDVVLQNFGGVG